MLGEKVGTRLLGFLGRSILGPVTGDWTGAVTWGRLGMGHPDGRGPSLRTCAPQGLARATHLVPGAHANALPSAARGPRLCGPPAFSDPRSHEHASAHGQVSVPYTNHVSMVSRF